MSKHSIDAFLEQVRTGELKNKTQKAYVALSGKSVSLQDLRKQTGIAHQTLTSSLSIYAERATEIPTLAQGGKGQQMD